MLVNCSGSELSTFAILDYVEGSSFPLLFYFIYALEYFFAALLIFLSTLFLYLSMRFKIWHTNLTVIMAFFNIASYLLVIGRVIFLVLNITGLGQDHCNMPFYLSYYFQVFYLSLVMHALPAVVFERWMAYKYLDDYETKNRCFISITTILVTILLSIFFTTITKLHWMGLYSITCYIFALCSVSFLSFMYLWWKNVQKLKFLSISATYTVSQRFQLKENIKVFRFLRNLVISSVANATIMSFIKLAMPILSNSEGYLLTPIVVVLDITLIVGIWSVESWRREIRKLFMKKPIQPFEDVVPVSEAGELYFQQLSKAWNK